MLPSLTVVLLFCEWIPQITGQYVTINTDHNGPITGFTGFTSFGTSNAPVLKFLGIPYAEAPIGERRFKKPSPKTAFTVPFNATQFGPACPQNPHLMSQWIPGEPYMSEDCLSLNIYLPTAVSTMPSVGYPVMIWLHGGAFVIGQSQLYHGENLAYHGQVIVVTINYRLGPFGFLVADDQDHKGNYGLWDQHLAFQWVHNNIKQFGGDPGSVTVFGESAGGASAIYQAMFPGNRGLFQRVIAESGSAYSAWAFQDKNKTFEYTQLLGKAVGCSDLEHSELLIRCLKSKPYKTIVDNMKVGTLKETLFRAEFAPVVDHEIVPVHPNSAFGSSEMPEESKSFFSEIDVMTGINDGDGGFIATVALLPYIKTLVKITGASPMDVLNEDVLPLVLIDRYGSTSPTLNSMTSFVYRHWDKQLTNTSYLEELLDISSDNFFFIPSFFTARAHARLVGGRPTYLFRFGHRSSYLDPPHWIRGAGHGDEIPYVFGFPQSTTMQNAYGYSQSVNQEEQSLSMSMMTYWSNFAKSGNPNFPMSPHKLNLPDWPMYDVYSKPFLNLNLTTSVGHRMYSSREEFWLNLAPEVFSGNFSGHGYHTPKPNLLPWGMDGVYVG